MNLKKEQQIFFALVLLQPILDVIAYFQYNNVIGSIAGYSRLLIMLVLPIYVFFTTKKKKSFFCFLAVIGLYSVLHILNGFRVGYLNLFQDVAYLLRVIQMPILTVSFIYYMKNQEEYVKVTAKSYFINSLLIFLVIVIGVITDTCEMTYQDTGLLGWFGNSNSQSIIMTCLIPFAVYFLIHTKKYSVMIIGLLVTTFLLLSNGTKGAYYSAFLIYFGFIAFFIFEAILKKKRPDNYHLCVIAILLIAGIGSALAYPITPRYEKDHEYYSAREDELMQMNADLEHIKHADDGREFDVNDPVIYAALVEYYEPLFNEGLVKRFGIDRVLEAYDYVPDPYIISDNRLVKRMYAQFIWEDSDFLTHLVGFEYTRIDDFDLENDFPAIFYYYGYIGLVMYVGFLLYFVYLIVKRLIQDFKSAITMENFTLLLTLGLLLGLAQYSGALLRRPNGSIYLSIVLALIFVQCKKPWKKRIEE